MLNQVLYYINNFYKDLDYEYAIDTTFTNTTTMTGDFADTFVAGEYVLISGSRLNDGLIAKIDSINDTTLVIDSNNDRLLTVESEVEVNIIKLALPYALIKLIEDIANYVLDNGVTDGVASESIDDYSIAYASADSSWSGMFKARLSKFRKLAWR